MRKRILLLIQFAVFGVILTSCEKNNLVFPEQVADDGNGEGIDIIAKPSDVEIRGTYDYKFYITWPTLSDKVTKATLKYMDQEEEKILEITDFSKILEITTTSVAEYAFDLTYYTAEGTPSKTVRKLATNRGYVVDFILDNYKVNKRYNKGELSWENDAKVPLSVKASYLVGDVLHVDTVLNRNSLNDTLRTSTLPLGVNTLFLEFTDASGRVKKDTVTLDVTAYDYNTAALKKSWLITATNSHSEGLGPQNLLDGVTTDDNHWHTNWTPDPSVPQTVFPHTLTITLSDPIIITSLEIFNRSGGSNDGARTFDVIGIDANNVETIIASNLEQVVTRGQAKTFKFPSNSAISKSVKIVIKDGWPRNGSVTGYTHLAEINISGIGE